MTGRSAVRLLLAGAGAQLLYRALVRRPPGSSKAWTRVNHRGDQLTLLEGPAVAGAAVAGAAVVPGLDGSVRAALAVAGIGAGAVGCYDDLAGSGDRRGLRGHLGALAKGEVTTGAVKLIGVGAAGFAASLLLSRRGRAATGAASGGPAGADGARGSGAGDGSGAGSLAGSAADVVINTALIAGMANLINLFDLRPGRAIKVSLLTGAAIGATGKNGRAAVAAPVGAALGLLNEDLGERAMLGDAGANALGAMLGTAAAATLPRPARVGAVAVITGLTIASEKISFTKVIERTPTLRWLDMLGRKPFQPPPSGNSAASPAPESAPANTVAPTAAGVAGGGDGAASGGAAPAAGVAGGGDGAASGGSAPAGGSAGPAAVRRRGAAESGTAAADQIPPAR